MRPVLTAVVASILLTTQAIAQEPWPRDDVDFVPEQLVDVLYADGYYEAARGMCAFCLSLKSTPTEARSHVRFIDAECCRLQGQYVAAAIKFRALLEETPTHPRRKEITERLFDIANYWINDTREEMREYEKTGEPRTGWAMIRGLIRLDPEMPIVNAEEMALQMFETVRKSEAGRGPLAEKAMFYSATICFFRKRFGEAGEHYERLSREMPDSEFAAKATKQALICRMIRIKDENDTTNIDAARTLIDRYRTRYPNDAARDEEFLDRQRTTIASYEKERAKNRSK